VKSVAILGGAGCKKLPKTDETWVCNFQPSKRVKYTRCFQLHPYAGRDPAEDEWLRDCDVPIYTITDEDNPHNRIYPIQDAMLLGGPFCSSFDYMMALAILEGFTSIHLAGIALQMGSARERLLEHVSLAYWVGYARAKNIRVTVHGHGVLYFPHRYGYDYQKERTFGQRMSFWGLLSMVDKFDDGAAKTDPQGWVRYLTPEKIIVSI